MTAPFSGTGNQYIFGVVAYGEGFVAVGEDFQSDSHVDGAIWTSPNGTSWSRVGVKQGDLANAQVDQVVTDGQRLIAIGRARIGGTEPDNPTPIIWLSDDGATWRRRSDPQPPFGDTTFSTDSVVGVPSGFIAWGVEGAGTALFHSNDGETWQRLSTGALFHGAMVGGLRPYRGGLVAVGSHVQTQGDAIVLSMPDRSTAAAWWSADGVTWHDGETAAGPGLGSLEIGPDGLLSVGGSGTGGIAPGIVWHSDDGRAWRQVGPDVRDQPAFASDGSRIIRFDWQGTGAVSTSTDGLTWHVLAGHLVRVSQYGMVLGKNGILIVESIPKGIGRPAPPDEVDAGVWYIAAH